MLRKKLGSSSTINPLKKKLGEEFFKNTPQAPGVYFMYSKAGSLLYVGKAKNLRHRLNSYKNATRKKVTRKVMRLCNAVDRIDWEVCQSEADALLTENHFLRTHKPPYNRVNTRPERYYFIGFDRVGSQLHFWLTTNEGFIAQDSKHCFGAFRGRHRARWSFLSFLRLLWISQSEGQCQKLKLPSMLSREKAIYKFSLSLSSKLYSSSQEVWIQAIIQFFSGESDALLHRITQCILEKSDLSPIYYAQVQEDLDLLKEFFEFGPKRNYELSKKLGLKDSFIPQDELDDLLVFA